MKTIFILSTIIFIAFGSMIGQVRIREDIKKRDLLEFGRSAERFGDTYSAIEYYALYVERANTNLKVKLKLANLYLSVSDYEKAKPLFLDVIKNGAQQFPGAYRSYAMVLKSEQQYDSAIKTFELYRDLIPFKINSMEYVLEKFQVENEITGCMNAASDQNESNGIQILKLNESINKANKDYAPVLWNDSVLIYSSSVSDTVHVTELYEYQNAPVDRFYSARLKSGEWFGGDQAPEPFSNMNGLSVSGGVLSIDKKRFYFTASKLKFNGGHKDDLYVCSFENGQWSNPTKMGSNINHRKFSSSQVAVGSCYDPDLEVIYFISDRPGGIGGTDIWYTVFDKKSWSYSKPVNAGLYINTPGNELSPYFDQEHKNLYFSSDGLPGFGGFDIYKTTGELVNWIPVENVGLPFNSPYHDLYFSTDKDRAEGFLVSNRSETTLNNHEHCCYDIFQFQINNPKSVNISGIILESDEDDFKNILDGKEKNNRHSSSNSVVELFLKNKNNGEFMSISKDTTLQDGSFEFSVDLNRNYLLTVTKSDFLTQEIEFNTIGLNTRIVTIEPITIIPVSVSPIRLENIYFEYNKWDLNQNSTEYMDSTLLVLMRNYQNIVIQITAHTDAQGDEDYNLMLSKNRAMSVVNYLIENGIERERMIALGYGEAKPVICETDISGNDLSEARRLNRRIEFNIVGILKYKF